MVDRVTKAERKLAGLCPACGADSSWRHKLRMFTSHHQDGSLSHPQILDECSRCYYVYDSEDEDIT